MAKNSVGDWSTTAADNTDVGGINIAEGCAAANVNDAMREIMAQLAALNLPADALTAGGAETITGAWSVQAFWTFTKNVTLDRTGEAAGAYFIVEADSGQEAGYRIVDAGDTTRTVLGTDGSDNLSVGGASWTSQSLVGAWSVGSTLTVGGAFTVSGSISGTSITGDWRATQAEAEAGATAIKVMTPERTKQAVDATTFSSAQSSQDVLASRTVGTIYSNNTGRPISVALTLGSGSSGDVRVSPDSSGSNWNIIRDFAGAVSDREAVSFIVGPDERYQVQSGSSVVTWVEYR